MVNAKREDKLLSFSSFNKKDPESLTFAIAVGGDAAPIVGMSFLVSFLNVGKRIASSSESYLIFGGDVKETSTVVGKFVQKLLADLKYLESKVFEIAVGEKLTKVEFAVAELPNDMKMLAFLSGELSNSAHYFCSNVNKSNQTLQDSNILMEILQVMSGNHLVMPSVCLMLALSRNLKLN